MAQYCAEYNVTVQECNEVINYEAKTYYTKDTKEKAKKTSLEFFKFYLENILGLKNAIACLNNTYNDDDLNTDINDDLKVINIHIDTNESSNFTKECKSCILSKNNIDSNIDKLNKSSNSNFEYYMKKILKSNYNNNAIHKITRQFDLKNYEIEISFDIISKEIKFNAVDIKNPSINVKRKISLEKIQDVLLNKINLIQALPNYFCFNFLKNLNQLFEFFLTYYFFINHASHKFSKITIAISPQLLGNTWSLVPFAFLGNKNLLYDIFIYGEQMGRFIVYDINE